MDDKEIEIFEYKGYSLYEYQNDMLSALCEITINSAIKVSELKFEQKSNLNYYKMKLKNAVDTLILK